MVLTSHDKLGNTRAARLAFGASCQVWQVLSASLAGLTWLSAEGAQNEHSYNTKEKTYD